MHQMWSFDIFDTCLARRYAFPTDLFLDLAQRLQDQLHPLLGDDYQDVFREARVESERLALVRCGKEETTLDEIWKELILLIPNLDDALGKSIELELESQSLYSIASVANLIGEARKRFGMVVFISDTYLPKSFIEEQLKAQGLLDPADSVFVSSESRATKRTGELYKIVCNQLCLPPNAFIHHGDNLHSDVKMASRAGMRAVHLTEGLLNRHEKKIARRLKHLDGGVCGKLVGKMREARIIDSHDDENAVRSLVFSFIGPFLWIFAEWILRRATADGLQRLYFFSRDCHGLHKIAGRLTQQMNLEIDCRYLRVSRQSLLLPSITEISPTALPWLRRSWEQSSLKNTLAKLDLNWSDVNRILCETDSPQTLPDDLKNERDWSRFWEVIQSEPIHKFLLDRVEERRHAALAFFTQEGMLDGTPSGIVDFGWFQSGQFALLKLLRLQQPKVSLKGYYLGLRDGRGPYMPNCHAQAIFHEPPFDRRRASLSQGVFSRTPIIEHVLNCAPHGSTRHYEQDDSKSGIFTAVEASCKAEEVATKQKLLNELNRFANFHVRPLNPTALEVKEILSVLIDTIAEEPLEEWGKLLSSISVADDQNNRDSSSLVKSRSLSQLILDMCRLKEFTALPENEKGYWPEITFASCTPKVRAGYNAIRFIRRGIRSISN